MDLSYGNALIPVQPGRPLRVREAQGRHLSVVKGAVWITQDCDLRDTVLEAGVDFVFDRPGLAVVQPLGGEAMIALEDGIELERAGSAWSALTRFWNRLERARRRVKVRGALRALSDRELRDIGVCRSQIELIGC